MSGLVGILLSVLGFTSVVDKNGIDSMHPVITTKDMVMLISVPEREE